ncbi:MAG: sensor histidine kinase [Anaerolineales bacterium]
MKANQDFSHLQTLVALGSKLNDSENFEDILQEIADVAAEITNSHGSSILLFEEETHQLYFAAARAENREDLLKLRVPIENSIAGWVYHQKSPMNIDSKEKEPLIDRVIDQTFESSINNLLAVPIIFREETLGTLEVINKSDSYKSGDQEILEILASFTATFVRINELQKKANWVEQERKDLQQQKYDFTQNTSREIRTPLGLILGHATFLKEIIHDDFYKDNLDSIINNANKLRDIIETLTNVTEFDSESTRIRWQEANLSNLLDSVVNSYQDFAQENKIKLEINLPKKPTFIQCDAAKLSVAIGNIIKNGIIFSNAGQNVLVSLHLLPGHAQISISDTGIGIPSEDTHLIFERFYQVESHITRSRGGMGLGLSVSKSIVESLGGYIWVESVLGKGSTFSILLPLASKLPE